MRTHHNTVGTGTSPAPLVDEPMVSRRDLEALRQRQAKPDSPVLSVYLDTDQSKAVNVNRAFEVVLKNMLREVEQPLDKSSKEEFQADAERVLRFLEDYRKPKNGLVIFCDASENFFWLQELGVSLRDGAWWHETPFLRPLIELVDEHERYGVVLTDREHARLFTVFLGEIEEHREAFAEADVKHIKSPGTDHLLSQMNIQRKADEHAHWHLERVAELMSRLANIHEFDRLILAGPVKAAGELYGLLPKALRVRVVREIHLPVDANEAQVLEETLKIEEEVERRREADLIERLITAAAKKEKAVLGIDETLLALQGGRVWQLVYAEGFTARGAQCTNCEALLAKLTGPCVYCGKAMRVLDDLIETAAERVVDMEGKVEQVRGSAAARFRDAGSIGAFLRF